MKINRNLIGHNPYILASSGQGEKKIVNKKNKEVEIEISESGKKLARELQGAKDADIELDFDKLDKIKEEIKSGEYKASVEKIAEKMVKAIRKGKGSGK